MNYCILSIKMVKQSNKNKQSGFILILVVVVLVVGASAYFVASTSNFSWKRQTNEQLEAIYELNQIKKQLLLFATNFSEIYANTALTSNVSAGMQPSPGYLPCPYVIGGAGMSGSCQSYVVDPSAGAGPGFVAGFLPPRIANRKFYFKGDYSPPVNPVPAGGNAPTDYVILIDERFVYQNANYAANMLSGTSTNRFAPLNDELTGASPSNTEPPVLRLNDDGKNYVALIVSTRGANIYPAQNQATLRPAPVLGANPLASLFGYLDRRYIDSSLTTRQATDNQTADFQFYSARKGSFGVNDLIVGITYEQWQGAVWDRICGQKDNTFGLPSLETSSTTSPSWYETYHVTNNPTGGSWRTRIAGGFCDTRPR